MSDTHGQHADVELPTGRIIVHCGDALNRGYLQEATDFAEWFSKLPYEHKIYVPGNHDSSLEDSYVVDIFRQLGIYVLIDKRVMLEGIRFYGTPWVPTYGNWAFMRSEEDLLPIYSKIPNNIDVLITHGPPSGIGDLTRRGINAGSTALLQVVKERKPKYHVFGHIHEARTFGFKEINGTKFANVANLDRNYVYLCDPMTLEL